MAFAVLAQGFTTGGQASVGAQHATTAVTLAGRVMADLESGERAVDSGSTGQFVDEPDFSWSVKSDVDDPGLRLLTVEVTWTERGETRVYALSRYGGLAIVDISKVKKNREKIADLYVQKGFYLATVDYEIKPVNEAEVDVWFKIDEKAKVKIREVQFIGNNSITNNCPAGSGAASFTGTRVQLVG